MSLLSFKDNYKKDNECIKPKQEILLALSDKMSNYQISKSSNVSFKYKLVASILLLTVIGSVLVWNKLKLETNKPNSEVNNVITKEDELFKDIDVENLKPDEYKIYSVRSTSFDREKSFLQIETLKAEATHIVEGIVVESQYEYSKRFSEVLTYSNLIITDSVKGDLRKGEKIKIVEPGGIIKLKDLLENDPYANKKSGNYTDEQLDMYVKTTFEQYDNLKKGDKVLLYLIYDDRLDAYQIVGINEGKFYFNNRNINSDPNEIVERQARNVPSSMRSFILKDLK